MALIRGPCPGWQNGISVRLGLTNALDVSCNDIVDSNDEETRTPRAGANTADVSWQVHPAVYLQQYDMSHADDHVEHLIDACKLPLAEKV